MYREIHTKQLIYLFSVTKGIAKPSNQTFLRGEDLKLTTLSLSTLMTETPYLFESFLLAELNVDPS